MTNSSLKKFKRVIVAGLGSVGSFIAESIVKINDIDNVVVIDYDKVEEGNLRNSIYRKEHIGMSKAKAFAETVSKTGTDLVCIEGRFPKVKDLKLTKKDLIIDCTDDVLAKPNSPSCKVSMIGSNLCIDGRRKIEKSYVLNKSCLDITRYEVMKASNIFSSSLVKGQIEEIIERNLVVVSDLNNEITLPYENGEDFIYQECENHEQVRNIVEHWDNLVKVNKKRSILVQVRTVDNVILSERYMKRNEIVEAGYFLTNLVSMIKETKISCEFTASFELQLKTPIFILYPYIFSA